MTRSTLALLLMLASFEACDVPQSRVGRYVYNAGLPARGERAIRYYGCGSCHTIPGIPGANGLVGPKLDQMAERVYIAGVLTNTPENLVTWIRFPKHVDAKTAMPELGVSERDARDIASYLYDLP